MGAAVGSGVDARLVHRPRCTAIRRAPRDKPGIAPEVWRKQGAERAFGARPSGPSGFVTVCMVSPGSRGGRSSRTTGSVASPAHLPFSARRFADRRPRRPQTRAVVTRSQRRERAEGYATASVRPLLRQTPAAIFDLSRAARRNPVPRRRGMHIGRMNRGQARLAALSSICQRGHMAPSTGPHRAPGAPPTSDAGAIPSSVPVVHAAPGGPPHGPPPPRRKMRAPPPPGPKVCHEPQARSRSHPRPPTRGS